MSVEAHPARPLVKRLTAKGYSPEQIASMLENRVSSRTVYRWGTGGSDPQNPSTLEALRALTEKLCKPV